MPAFLFHFTITSLFLTLHQIYLVFENNDVESDLDEMWVMKKEEYDALTLTADSAIPQCTSPESEEHFHEDEEITSKMTDRNAATKNQVFSDEDIGRIIEEASVLNHLF